ncbi:protein tyrosine phosphatase [Tieghemostelium lacteum]|uniref:Phosphatidylinositol 3,4,5-trisphosphate 3-phosphatase and dual-specificity protein phosphatase PTEN n=1 Tax=Tieghemostelium lacteum TaxID=361077 RepID=A0A151Z734_TIELA|nr:protein tyrosine phosphatase [Tieghemostelium lacteum]|eukprot:KYQ89772.1 protein tyrosine phosphatase [Tieghemostelium lacteum]
MSNILRVAVSKQKRRYQKDGFDLDLAYITDRIIAMGFPSEKVEGVFRNPMKEVQKFLDQFHKDHYKVYNLCSERDYDHSKFYGRVGCFPFDDHNAPAFELIEQFCKDVDQWMKEDPKNIAVIHCKAGKGRTGLMICCWLLYCGWWQQTEDSLKYYAALRTYNQKGVTIPSQIRYVHYFGKSIREKIQYSQKPVLIKKILLKPLPKETNLSDVSFTIHVGKTLVFSSKDAQNVTIHRVEKKKKSKSDKKSSKGKNLHKENSQPQLTSSHDQNKTSSSSGGTINGGHGKVFEPSHSMSQMSIANGGSSSPTLEGMSRSQSTNSISNLDYQAYSSSVSYFKKAEGEAEDEYIAYDIGSLPLVGDVKVDFSDKNERMFMFWFNTYFVNPHELVHKIGLDKAYKDKHHKTYPEDFRVEMFFENIENTSSSSNDNSSSSAATLVASSHQIQPSSSSSSSSSNTSNEHQNNNSNNISNTSTTTTTTNQEIPQTTTVEN